MGQRLVPGWVCGCLPALACAAGLILLGCGSELSSPDGGGQPGMCSADVPPGQSCNTLANVATAITPTCVTGTMPAGAGGAIVDGTYVLTAQTYYNAPGCSTTPVSETIVISGSCLQLVFGDGLIGNGSLSLAIRGNTFTQTSTCSFFNFDATAVAPDAPGKTYTATATTFTLFTNNTAVGNPNPDRIEVLTRQ